MPRNDPMRDGIWSETPGIGTDFEDMLFEDIEADDLLWLRATRGDANQVHRKIDDHTALNIKTNTIVTIPARQTIYQKT
tara:strand:+ start:169 stop:405 length:237 start_codon:yes stop_codon:yes gene_type:complete